MGGLSRHDPRRPHRGEAFDQSPELLQLLHADEVGGKRRPRRSQPHDAGRQCGGARAESGVLSIRPCGWGVPQARRRHHLPHCGRTGAGGRGHERYRSADRYRAVGRAPPQLAHLQKDRGHDPRGAGRLRPQGDYRSGEPVRHSRGPAGRPHPRRGDLRGGEVERHGEGADHGNGEGGACLARGVDGEDQRVS